MTPARWSQRILGQAPRLLIAAAGLLLIIYLLPSWRGAGPERRAHVAMGTVVTVKLYGDPETTRNAMESGTAEIDRIESIMSHYSGTSELARVESLAAISAAVCSPELAQVIRRSQELSRSSDGAFDITVGAYSRLWNFADGPAVPNPVALKSARERVDYRLVQLDGNSLRLHKPGVRLDLGAAAKGYAVDRATTTFQRLGVACGLIEAGGDIRYWGRKPDGSPWRFGIQHPRLPDAIIEVEDIGLSALATSGDYEQYFESGGQRFHHILDPKTGYPARVSVSATVWAENALDADILATAAFVMGPLDAISWIESLPRTEALIFFDRDGELDQRATSGIVGRFHFAQR